MHRSRSQGIKSRARASAGDRRGDLEVDLGAWRSDENGGAFVTSPSPSRLTSRSSHRRLERVTTAPRRSPKIDVVGCRLRLWLCYQSTPSLEALRHFFPSTTTETPTENRPPQRGACSRSCCQRETMTPFLKAGRNQKRGSTWRLGTLLRRAPTAGRVQRRRWLGIRHRSLRCSPARKGVRRLPRTTKQQRSQQGRSREQRAAAPRRASEPLAEAA